MLAKKLEGEYGLKPDFDHFAVFGTCRKCRKRGKPKSIHPHDEQLDTAIKPAVETIPEKNRKLLTYHDSFPFFGPRYGLKIIGAIQPSDFGEPSAQKVAALITQIRQEGVPAVFGSEVFPSKVLEQLAKESGA